MESIMTLTVHDISKKLGVHPRTITRWIIDRKLKATMENNRQGYKVLAGDFEKFLEEYPIYRSINDENLPYEAAKSDILRDLMIGLYELQRRFLIEGHGKVYSEGWNDAIEKVDGLIKQTLVDTY